MRIVPPEDLRPTRRTDIRPRGAAMTGCSPTGNVQRLPSEP